MKTSITVFTPTYNRKEKLAVLYESLCRQTDKDFVWYIVDDGSTDETGKRVEEWMQEGILSIRYEYQRNGGKHRAHNRGVQACDTEWFLCVDSDDFLDNRAIEIIKKKVEMVTAADIGLIFPKYESQDGYQGPWFPDGSHIHMCSIKMTFGRIVEAALVIRTECLKRHLCLEVEGENFLSEEILHNALMEEGTFVTCKEKIYIFKYLADGLTSQVFQLWKKNPKEAILMLLSRYEVIQRSEMPLLKKWKQNIMCIMNLNALCMATGRKITEASPNIKLSVLLFGPSVFFKKKRFG